MERRRQTRGNCLCSAALSGAASKLGPPGVSMGMPDITLIPQQQKSPREDFHAGAGRDAPGCDVSSVLIIKRPEPSFTCGRCAGSPLLSHSFTPLSN